MTRRRWWLLALSIAALALAASANSIANGYAYDDVGLIAESARVHSWHNWWREFAQTYWPGADGYRPLTIIAWRAQWALGDGNPAVFHAMNVALHVAGATAVFWMSCAMLPVAAAWLAAALYAVHPVHVEAIANVVGQSELAVALLVVLIVGLYAHGRIQGELTRRRWRWIATLYAMACLFKEHAIVAPALIVLAEATLSREEAPFRQRLARMRLPLLALALVAVTYLWARSAVVVDGLAGFNPFAVFDALQLSATDRILTMIGASPVWLRLLLWPARLAAEYSPPDLEVAQGVSVAQLPGLLVLLGTIGLVIACWRRSPVSSFGIAWTVVALLPASNFLVPAGFIIAERTLLLPSVGAMIAVASLIPMLSARVASARRARVVGAGAVALLLGLGIARSYSRNPVWRDNDSLFRQSVIDSPNSYRSHFMLGAHEFSASRFAEGEAHYRRAIELFPHDPLVAWAFAEQLRAAGKCEGAVPLYHWLFTVRPDARRGHLGYAACLLLQGQFEDARSEALVFMARGGRVSLGREILAGVKAARDSMRTR